MWQTLASEPDTTDPVQAFYRDQLAQKILQFKAKLDRVIILWRRTKHWIPTHHGIGMPQTEEARDTCHPLDGAKQLIEQGWSLAHEQKATQLAFVGYGFSTSGTSAQELFRLRVRPFEEEEDDEIKTGKLQGLDAFAAPMRVVTDTIDKMGDQLGKSFDREMGLADKVIGMAGTQQQSFEGMALGLKTYAEMARDKYEHTEKLEDMKSNTEMFDRLLGHFGPGMGRVFEDWLRVTFGMKADVLSGPFAKRLSAIWESLKDEQRAKVKTELGNDAHTVLLNMLGAADDATFQSLGQKFLETLGPEDADRKLKLRKLSQIIGMERGLALLKLLVDAGLAEM